LEVLIATQHLFTDASNIGWGAAVRHLEAHGLWSAEEKLLHINLLELQAVSRGLSHFQNFLKDQVVCVMSDNTTVVSYINKQGGTRSSQLCHQTLDLLKWTEEKNIILTSTFVPGALNVVADRLSRKHQILKSEWTINNDVLLQIWKIWDRPMIDLFATNLNHRLPLYYSPTPDDQSLGRDAMVQNWGRHLLYAFPPTALIRSVLNKISEDLAEVILIAPYWPNQEWFPDLMALLIDLPRSVPLWNSLLRQPHMSVFHTQPQVLALHAWRLSADSCKQRDFLNQLHASSPRAIEEALQHSTKGSGKLSWIGARDGKLILSIPLFP
jgi:ribonuclease HI